MPVIIEFSRYIGTYLSAKFELLINIEELKLMSQTIGGERTNEILRSIGEFLEILSEKNVYFLDHYTFCIMYMDKNNIRIDSNIQSIIERFNSTWEENGNKIHLECRLMSIATPHDVSNIDAFYFCNNTFRKFEKRNSNVILINDIDLEKADRRVKIASCINSAIENDYFTMYYPMCRKTTCFSYGDIRHFHRIYASN